MRFVQSCICAYEMYGRSAVMWRTWRTWSKWTQRRLAPTANNSTSLERVRAIKKQKNPSAMSSRFKMSAC